MNRGAGPQNEAELLRRLRAGESEAFVELVRRYHAPLRQLAAGIVGDAQAEEAVQEGWLAAMRNLDRFEGRSSLKTWLYTIVGNEAKSRLRKSRREVPLDTEAGEMFPGGRFLPDGHWAQAPGAWHEDSPEALLSQEDFLRCLEGTLGSLPEAQRAALMLRDEDGLDLDAICNVLGVSASNARVLLHRARIRVYRMIEHFEETGTC